MAWADADDGTIAPVGRAGDGTNQGENERRSEQTPAGSDEDGHGMNLTEREKGPVNATPLCLVRCWKSIHKRSPRGLMCVSAAC